MRQEDFIKDITVSSFEELPIGPGQRRRTDVFCIWISTLFILAMFILAMVSYNKTNLAKVTYPTDSSGLTCGYDLKSYPYVYFTSPTMTSQRLCVNKCPQKLDSKLSCSPTAELGCGLSLHANSTVQIYDTKLEQTRLGLFCLPTHIPLKQRILQRSKLLDKYQFLGSYDAIQVSLLCSLALGILFLLMVQCMPNAMVHIAVLAGAIVSCTLGGYLTVLHSMVSNAHDVAKVALGVGLIISGIILVLGFLWNTREIRLFGVFMRSAANFVSNNIRILAIIPVFLVLMACLLALFLFQLLAYYSSGVMQFSQSSLYYSAHSYFFSILMIVNFVWLYGGFSFLNQTNNFIVSGQAVEWYMQGNPRGARIDSVTNLFCYHWGSVVAGSFMLGFFTLPDMIFDLFKPSRTNIRQTGCYANCFHSIFGCFQRLFQMVRSESMAYIQITGIPYCNASRYCQFLSNNSKLFPGSQSINRFYRISSHLLLSCISTFIGITYMLNANGSVSLYACIFIMVVSSFIVTVFISLHMDAATAILTTLLLQERLNGSINFARAAPRGLVRQLLQ